LFFLVKDNVSEEEAAQALAEARRDIASTTEFIAFMITGLRGWDRFGDGSASREIKIATLAEMIHEQFLEDGPILVGAVAVQLLAESGVEVEVEDPEQLQKASQEAAEQLRRMGVIK
jgi:hypothetical protein